LRVDIPREDTMVVLQMTAHDAKLIAEAIVAKAKEAEAAAG
jgi:hypothetical protein